MRLWLLILAALAVRLAGVAAAWDIDCAYDECFYGNLAHQLADGEGFQPHARHYWPPGYIAYLAGHLKLGLGLGGARITQAFLSTLLVPMIFLLGRQAARDAGRPDGARVGMAAALLVAFHPTLVAYAHYLWSETLFLTLFTGALLLIHTARMRASGPLALAAGLAMGASCLVKVLPLYLVPLLAVWVIAGTPTRRGVRVAVLLMAGTMAVILPWTARNYAAYGRLVLIETTTGKNLVRGNNPVTPSNWDWGTGRSTRGVVPQTGCQDADLVDLDACLTRYGVEQIIQHPLRFVTRAGTKVADLVNPTSFLVRHIRRGLYGDWPPPLAHGAVTVIALFNMALMALAVWGWTRHGGAWWQLTVMMVLYTLAVHVVTFGMSRFRLPLMPVLVVGAVMAVLPWRATTPRRPRRHRQMIWATVILAILLVCWGARVPDLYAPPSPPGLSGWPGGG